MISSAPASTVSWSVENHSGAFNMARYNTIVKPEHIEEFGTFIEWLNTIGYASLNYDAVWKWSGILDAVFSLYKGAPSFDQCVDIGGGHSPIHRIMSNFGKVDNVDSYLFSADGVPATWFPLNDKGFFEESPGFSFREDNIRLLNEDFMTYIKNRPSDSVCLYVDGCSLIHMEPTSKLSAHDGATQIATEMMRTLKPGGYFISCCDIYSPMMKTSYPSLLRHDGVTYADNLYDIFCKSGLVPIDNGDYRPNQFYCDSSNYLQSIAGAPNHKRLNPKYSCCGSLPPYHAFAQIQDFPMLIARFVFRKPFECEGSADEISKAKLDQLTIS